MHLHLVYAVVTGFAMFGVAVLLPSVMFLVFMGSDVVAEPFGFPFQEILGSNPHALHSYLGNDAVPEPIDIFENIVPLLKHMMFNCMLLLHC